VTPPRPPAIPSAVPTAKPDPKADAALARAAEAFKAGASTAALREARAVLRRRADSVPALNIAGVAAAAVGEHDAARRYLERLRALQPALPAHLLRTLGTCYRALRRDADAVAAYRAATEAAPGDWEALNDYGTALAAGDDSDAAIAALTKACALAPKRPEPTLNLGNAFRAAGRLADAERAYRDAIALDPDYASAHANLAAVKTFTPDDPDLDALAGLARSGGLSDDAVARVNFALSKAYQDAGDIDHAFDALEVANRSARARIDGDASDDLARIAAWRDAFQGRSDADGPPADPPTGPIFVVGMPRSGTTVVERMLAAHADVFGAGERHDLRRLLYAHADDGDHVRVARRWARAGGKAKADLAAAYRRALDADAGGCARIVDKMLFNGHYTPLIAAAFPDARILHCRRHPMATCFSIYQQHFRTVVPWAYGLTDIATYFKAFEAMMADWGERFPGRLMTVDHERLVADPEAETRRFFAFCGVPWTSDCLAFHKAKGAVHTASAAQVRKPLNADGVERWKRYEHRLGALAEALGSAGGDAGR
jgi:tetratricopeptide (TPR) repeat protein